jgi:hypothetical protein
VSESKREVVVLLDHGIEHHFSEGYNWYDSIDGTLTVKDACGKPLAIFKDWVGVYYKYIKTNPQQAVQP